MEKVITFGIQGRGQTRRECESSLEELERLVETAGGRVKQAERDAPPPAPVADGAR